jgi:hypothetical protein
VLPFWKPRLYEAIVATSTAAQANSARLESVGAPRAGRRSGGRAPRGRLSDSAAFRFAGGFANTGQPCAASSGERGASGERAGGRRAASGGPLRGFASSGRLRVWAVVLRVCGTALSFAGTFALRRDCFSLRQAALAPAGPHCGSVALAGSRASGEYRPIKGINAARAGPRRGGSGRRPVCSSPCEAPMWLPAERGSSPLAARAHGTTR